MNNSFLKSIADSRKNKLRKTATPAEKGFLCILKRYRVPYRFQKIVYTEKTFYIIDFVIMTKPKIIFELDGTSHIGHAMDDRERTREILKTNEYRGARVIRIPNEDIWNGSAEKMVKNMFPNYKYIRKP